MTAQDTARGDGSEYYKMLFVANPLPMWVFEIASGRFLAVNAQACAQYGYSEEEFLAMTISDIRPPDENTQLVNVRSTGPAGHRKFGLWRHLKKDGTIITVEISSDDIVFRGAPSRLVLANDVTERVRTEAALRLSQERFDYVTRATADAVWDRNIADNSIWWNAGLQRLFGIPPEEVEGTIEWARERIHPDDREQVARTIGEAIRTGAEQWACEYRFRRHDGTYAFVYDRGFVIRNGAGRAVRVVGAITDLSDRKQREDTLREQAMLLDRAKDAIMVRGLDHRIRYWNHAAEAIYGISREQAIGKRVEDIVVYGDPMAFEAADAEVLKKGEWSGRLQQTTAGGKTITVDGHWTLLRDESGNPAGVLKIHTNASERVELERRLTQSQKLEAIGQLPGGIAHDFNNLLTVIVGNADTLTEELQDRSEILPLVEMIRTAGERGAELTRHLLAFARRQALEPRTVRPDELVDGMRNLLQRTLRENIELTVDHAADVAKVSVDPAQFESAVLNLCINARDAMPGGGKLMIETCNVVLDENYTQQRADVVPGDYVRISVSDTGTGMSAEDTARAFEPFFTTKARGQGTGLGLSMVYGFVKQSGGHVAIYSELGHGTVVTLYLRQAKGRSEPVTVIETGDVAAHDERVLLVEDDDLVRAHAVQLLTSLGYRVIVASNGPEALELLRNEVPCDILFTDVIMPGGLTGPKLAEAARVLRPGLPVLYTSGYTENAIVHHGRVDRGINLLHKPYRKPELAAKLRAVLDEKRPKDGGT
ncbi:MAG TPA: PAS domain S-box protein [Rhodanobacteraceae bacterium]|nr:PAS domain S-box protein [Rhodanobacteraceae bacterium]